MRSLSTLMVRTFGLGFVLSALLGLVSPVVQARPRTEDDAEEEAPARDEEPESAVHEQKFVQRFPGCTLYSAEHKQFDEYAIPTAWSDDDGDYKTKSVEGERWQALYVFPDTISVAEVLRNYKNALTAAGFKVLLDHKRNADERVLTAQAARPGKASLSVHLRVYATSGSTEADITFVQSKAMEQKVSANVSALQESLGRDGHVAVYGIEFATAKADVSPGSAEVLSTIAQLLQADPALRLRVEGHTDNVGKSAANLSLSKQRAAAVCAWLQKKHQIDPKRLVPEGFGDARPVDSNDTADGRARNRRVELARLP